MTTRCLWRWKSLILNFSFNPLFIFQSHYSLLGWTCEPEAFTVCKNEGLGLIPWGAIWGWVHWPVRIPTTQTSASFSSWTSFCQTWQHRVKCLQWRIQDFPEEGAPTPQGAPTYNYAKISQKLHDIEIIWTPRGWRTSLAPLLDLPLVYQDLNNLISHLNLKCNCTLTKHPHVHQNISKNIFLLIPFVKIWLQFNFIQQICTNFANLTQWG